MHKPNAQGSERPRASVPAVPRVSLSIDETAASTGLSRSTIYSLMSSGDLGFVKCGARRLITVAELEAFLGRLAQGGV